MTTVDMADMDVANGQLSPAQAAAARRREKILSNSNNRMNLVTGKSEVLEPAPAPEAKPVRTSASKIKSPSSRRYMQDHTVVRIFQWPIRTAMSIGVSSLLMFLMSFHWSFAKFLMGFFLLESLYFTLWLVHTERFMGVDKFVDKLLVDKNYESGVEDYLNLSEIFLGLQGVKARMYRSIVMRGMQSAADFTIYTSIYLVYCSFLTSSSS
ncbi:hypothetical protein RvY_00855 [Ramazzottius varieornatus]|uniref:Uncharacterized protein n=1 Tax=Ramazzottius varieornatus TaxID=947166 RepID=A0A1D1UE88_RAMVA|nr:hypothetical protein RvY_00855 [Ramazzottius varieornatus]